MNDNLMAVEGCFGFSQSAEILYFTGIWQGRRKKIKQKHKILESDVILTQRDQMSDADVSRSIVNW